MYIRNVIHILCMFDLQIYFFMTIDNQAIEALLTVKKTLIEAHLSKIRSIDNAIVALGGTIESSGKHQTEDASTMNTLVIPLTAEEEIKYVDYFKAKSFQGKVLSIIAIENRFLHSREIAAIINRVDPVPNMTLSNLTKKVSIALYAIRKAKTSSLTSKVLSEALVDTFWGSSDWIDIFDNKILPRHEPDMAQLSRNRKTKAAL